MGKDIAIVGGGMLGMALAHRLAGQGKRVALFEAQPELGGLAGSARIGSVRWDRYYHVILPGDSCLLALLAELGLSKQVVWEQTRTGLFIDGALHSVSSAREFALLPVLSVVDRLRFGLNVLYASKLRNWQSLDRVSAVAWLRRWSGRNVCARIWVPLLRAKLGEEYSRASAAFIWATVRRLYGARVSGDKKEKLGYVQGGYASVVGAMKRVLEKRGVTLKCDHRLWRVEPREQGGFLLHFANGAVHRAAKVVLTVPNPTILSSCPWLSETEQAQLRKASYMGIICLALLLRKPLGGYYLTNIADEGLPFTGIIEMSALVGADSFQGYTLVYLPKYVPSDDQLFLTPDEEVLESFLNGLQRMYPALKQEDIAGWTVARDGHVFALPTLGYSEIAPPMCASTPGLFIVNSAQIVSTTLNVNEAVRQAEEAATVIGSS
ncbi:MAG: FAD-dependent oxidoreductase [candidate division KSB1 bacterium]|nr:FAD-dependent oxidoreductase [candidate division KSB1 bacterium]